jgi:N-formylmaleamate deformylase
MFPGSRSGHAWVALAALVVSGVAGCATAGDPSHGDPPGRGRRNARADQGDAPFGANTEFQPTAFGVTVTGHGRPIVFIPGLGCPGDVWAETVAHLGDGYQAHVLTLSGFPGRPPIGEPLSAAVRRDLTRYIRARHLVDPIIVGHSMGGFIAYWIASYHPELVGPVIVVDASPALSGGLDEAKQLRTKWKDASDEQFEGQIRAAFTSMTKVPKRMAPVIEEIVRSDRRTIGDAIYEMVTTDLTGHVREIKAPVLVIAADGGLQKRIRDQIEGIPDHQLVVVPGTRHFVMWDDPVAFYGALDAFLARHPPNN